jgi:geranylgeranyl diphosphate synthase type II
MELVQTTDRAHAGTRTEPTGEGRPTFHSYLERVKPRIDERIMANVGGGPAEAPIDPRFETPLRLGKRMRAGLLMLIFETLGQEGGLRMALDLASAVEIAHAASLIVDDMLDEDETRHGITSLHITAGHKSAMLGTIGLLSYPYQIASRYGDDCVTGLARTHRAMVKGATRELKSVPSFGVGQTYDGIIENKTGVLFCLTARYGAMAAGCSPRMIEQCAEFGMLTGKAMQIADDVADLRSLLNGQKARIGGSEVILLRRCLGQAGEGTEELGTETYGPLRPIVTERRKDIEETLNKYLEAAIRDAVGVTPIIDSDRPAEGGKDHLDRDLPELCQVPAEIASMVINERK